MEKIKEKIENLKKSFVYANDLSLNTLERLVDQELQDYTFIRVPKKVKLSEITKYLEDKAKKDTLAQDYKGDLMWRLIYRVRKPTNDGYIQILEDCIEEPRDHIPSQLKVAIYNNKITCCDFILIDKYKELYDMWFYGTFIEVDV